MMTGEHLLLHYCSTYSSYMDGCRTSRTSKAKPSVDRSCLYLDANLLSYRITCQRGSLWIQCTAQDIDPILPVSALQRRQGPSLLQKERQLVLAEHVLSSMCSLYQRCAFTARSTHCEIAAYVQDPSYPHPISLAHSIPTWDV